MKYNIKLSREEYKTLLALVYAGDWLINSHRIAPIEKFAQLHRYLFSLTKEFKIEGISLEDDPSYPTAAYEEGEVRDYIQEYDNETFWDELSERLTYRIFEAEYTKEQRAKMDRDTRFITICRIEDKVKAHLAIHGLNQIVINEDNKE